MIKEAFLSAIILSAGLQLSAQKVAHLNFDSLITLMPETKTATEAANQYLKGLETELVTMQTEFEGKYKDYMEKEASMGDLLKKTKQEDLQTLQTRIQDFQKKAEMDFRQKQAELTAPIMNKAKKGIEMVAKESGFRYVLDSSDNRTTILYSEASDDILALVKKKLDGMPLAQIPGMSAPGGTKSVAPSSGQGARPASGGK